MLFLSVLFHELGHVIAGRLVGCRTTEIVVQGIEFGETAKGWRWSFDHWHLGGHVRIPLNGLHRMKPRLAIISLGGPIMNVVMVGVGFLAVRLTGGSPYAMVWIFVNLWDLAISFQGDLENDYQHLRWIFGNDKASKDYLAGRVLYAEGIEEAERQTVLDEIGTSDTLAHWQYWKFVNEHDYDGARKVLLEIIETVESDRISRRLYYECEAAFRFAFQRFDIAKAKALLPPETRAVVYECEKYWLRAAAMVAMAEDRWAEVQTLSARALKRDDVSKENRTWFEMANKAAKRHLERPARA